MKPEPPIPGKTFREGRNNAGLSQAAVAEMLDKHTHTIRNWEKGTAEPAYYWYMMMRTGQI